MADFSEYGNETSGFIKQVISWPAEH